MLALYRRHTGKCGQKSRRYRRCSCPIWVQGTLGGEEIRKSLDLTSWEAAEGIVHAWKNAGSIGVEGKRVLIREASERYLRDARSRLKPSTVDLYQRGLKHLLSWCDAENTKAVPQLTIEVLRKYRESWTCRPVTAARRIDRLKMFLGFCVDSGWIQKNPAKLLKAPEAHVVGKSPFTEQELESIFEACGRLITRGTYGKQNVKRVRAFIYILRYTGLRISDAAKLHLSQVSNGKVLLRTEKTGTLVWIPIPQFVVQALSEVPRTSNFYFQTGKAKEKTVRGGWDRSIRSILSLAGVKHGSAHAFRTTLAVDLLNKGVPVETVAAILGNSPAIVMKHYAPFVASRQMAVEAAVRSIWVDTKVNIRESLCLADAARITAAPSSVIHI
jgi:site-specific recombinase XerD